MATVDEKVFNLDEIAAKQHYKAGAKRLRELQVIHAELQSLRRDSHVYTRIANGNVFLLTSRDDALSQTEKELKSLSHIKINSNT